MGSPGCGTWNKASQRGNFRLLTRSNWQRSPRTGACSPRPKRAARFIFSSCLPTSDSMRREWKRCRWAIETSMRSPCQMTGRVWPFRPSGEISVWETENQKRVAGPLVQSGVVEQIRFTPNGALLVSVSTEGHAAVWEVATGRRLYEPLSVGEHLKDIDIDREGKHCAVATLRGVTIWDLASGQRVHRGLCCERTFQFRSFPERARKGARCTEP